MAIPETQLDTWANQGAVKQSRDTYATVKRVLESSDASYFAKNYTSFLQGSYGNDTNIYADSDVDVVMRLSSTFYHDLENLAADEQQAFKTTYPDATYGLADFKREVTDWLADEFGTAVKPGSKAIFIEGEGNRRDADVLVAAEFRRYSQFSSTATQSYAEGICFFLKDGTRIINFPKQHSDNCTSKHQATKQWFKPMVRVLKNMRNKMIEDGIIKEGLAPSYYLEGLLYNVPNDKFGVSYEDSFVTSINWILQADRNKFVCANEQYYLLCEGSPVTWRAASCDTFLTAAVEFWKNW